MVAWCSILTTILVTLVAESLCQSGSCGAQVSSMRSCGVGVFNKHVPNFYEKRVETYEKILACYSDSGCQNPFQMIEDMYLNYIRSLTAPYYMHMPPWMRKILMSTISKEFGLCYIEKIVKKVVFPEMEACIGEKFNIANYDLPPLSHYYKQGYGPLDMAKHYDYNGEVHNKNGSNNHTFDRRLKEIFEKELEEHQNQLVILAATMSEIELFDLEDPEMAHYLTWYVGELACNGSESKMDAAQTCMEGVAQEVWSSEGGKCKTPVKMAFEARDKFKDYCVDKEGCYDNLNETCMGVYKKEPNMLCKCGYHLPMKRSFRNGIRDGFLECLDMELSDLEEGEQDLQTMFYDMVVTNAEKVALEFCSLKLKIPCKAAFGAELMKTPKVDPQSPASILDQLRDKIQQVLS